METEEKPLCESDSDQIFTSFGQYFESQAVAAPVSTPSLAKIFSNEEVYSDRILASMKEVISDIFSFIYYNNLQEKREYEEKNRKNIDISANPHCF